MKFANESYRVSHQKKGEDYDAFLHSRPWDSYLAHVEKCHIESIVRNLPHQFYRAYLDYACGTGRITKTVERYFPLSHGIDVSKSMIKQAQSVCNNTKFFLKDITKEPHSELYDIVTAFRFFGNAENTLRIETFSAISHILRRGGLLVLNNHRNPNALHSLGARLTGFKNTLDLSHKKLLSLTRDAGFRQIATIPIAAWVIRFSMMRQELLNSIMAQKLEKTFAFRGLTPIAPNAIYIFRKE